MTGWQKINEDWYYFHDSGAMVTGWYPVGDHWYYFDEMENENRLASVR